MKMFEELFQRDLEKVKSEIEAFNNEENLWKTSGSVKNSAGTLTLHICGNLQHFIGATLGSSGYVRDRDFEFSGNSISKERLLSELNDASEVVSATLANISEDQLKANFPLDIPLGTASTEKVILHLFGHLSWHLGQVNYLRRILE